MSKQNEAKLAQGYTPKVIPQSCGNCTYFRADRVNTNIDYPQYGEYWVDKNMRCTLGGFAVKKMGTCNEWAGKDEATP